MIRRLTVAAATALLSASTLQAQGREIHILSVQATPIGALPPIALPMPASRNHHYWGIRLQTGRRAGSGDVDLNAIAAGLDLQYKGGSTFGLTAGYQSGDCGTGDSDCGGHALFGARTRINLFTGGPTVAGVIGDYSATSTIGTEVGFGWAPHILPGLSACTVDFGMPFSVAMLETVRLVSYITPGVVWDVDCSDEGAPSRASYLTGLGFGLQQLGHRGFDVYVGVQKIFLGQTGYQFGVSATFVRLPWGR
ncbi:MAG: hypothetical protein ACSLFK_03270 [Gemmatimonadaceae bacterium]